jgi:hypothetical protein
VTGTVTIIPDYGHTVTLATVTGGTRLVCKEGMGVPGITASAASAVVSFTIDAPGYTCAVTSSNGTRLAVTAGGGVPGVAALATGATGELSLTPTWAKTIWVTDSGTHTTCVDIDIPGVYATSALGVVTLTCTTPGSPAGGYKAPTLIFQQGTSAADEVAWDDNTLDNLIQDGALTSSVAANSTTAGKIYEQYVDGYPYVYLGLKNNDSEVGTVTVGCSLLA